MGERVRFPSSAMIKSSNLCLLWILFESIDACLALMISGQAVREWLFLDGPDPYLHPLDLRWLCQLSSQGTPEATRETEHEDVHGSLPTSTPVTDALHVAGVENECAPDGKSTDGPSVGDTAESTLGGTSSPHVVSAIDLEAHAAEVRNEEYDYGHSHDKTDR